MNVLILTDFSETSRNAGKYAVDFLQGSSVNFHLLNIHNFNFNRSARKHLSADLVKTLEKLQENIKLLDSYSSNKKHTFNTILSSENLISAVRKALVEKKIDLIFIGTVSHVKHEHPILGDHAYDVVKKIKCNIIAVPGKCTYVPPKRAVFPVDKDLLSINEQNRVLDDLNYLGSSKFTLLEINDGDVEYTNRADVHIPFKTPVPFTSKLFSDLQKEFDMIFVIGKNLNICDRLLHTENGFTANMDMQIPIFVYHD